MQRKWCAEIVFGMMVVVLGIGGAAWSGSLDSPAEPTDAGSAMYSLETIYNRLDTGAAGSASAFVEPSAGPTSGTGRTLNEVMDKAPEVDAVHGATAAQVLEGQTFWALSNEQWGAQIGTMPTQTLSATTETVQAGYYEATTLSAVDPDLRPEYIAMGVELFGMQGIHGGGDFMSDGSVPMTGALNLGGQEIIEAASLTLGTTDTAGQVVLHDADPLTDYTLTLQAPAVLVDDVTYTLPATDGTNGQVLTTNGTGTLSFLSPQASALSGTVAVGHGGTGADNAADARANLGLGSMAQQNANTIAVTGGTINNTVVGGTTPAAGSFTTLTADTLNTGQGDNELYAMNQNVQTTDEVTFKKATLTPGGAVVDQENFPATFYFGLPAGSWGAQTITAGMTGLLSKVKITVGHQGTPSDINISIYSGDTPNTGVLISSVETTTITTHFNSPLEYELEFSTPAPIIETQKYYILYELHHLSRNFCHLLQPAVFHCL